MIREGKENLLTDISSDRSTHWSIYYTGNFTVNVFLSTRVIVVLKKNAKSIIKEYRVFLVLKLL